MKIENVTIGVKGTEYGNWMSKAAIRMVGAVTAVLAIAFACVLALTQGIVWKIILGVLLLMGILLLVDVLRIRKALSYNGDKAMDLMQRNLMEHFDWDGRGTALDVGCGSGTITIRTAKTYPEAKVVGVDYWGAGWDYSKELCEKNAELEGVADRCEFKHGDANKLDFPDECFDALTANCVYTQIMGKNGGLKSLIDESLRTLKKGSPFVIQDYFEREKMFGSVDKLIEHLKDSGVSEVYFEGGLDSTLPKVVIRPYCIKGTAIIWGVK